jgi:succinoglycan biosynthesis transport protein ExoP
MNTEINIMKSKSVALRVAKELGLDKHPGYLPHNRLAEFLEWIEFPRLGRVDTTSAQSTGGTEEGSAEKLDEAADAIRKNLQVWSEAFVIFVSATSENPIQAQRLASTVADDYLASQREARQEALQRVATWLKGRVDDLQSRVLETESSIEKLKAEMGIPETGSNNVNERQIIDLNTQIANAHSEVEEKRARLEQVRNVIDSKGDIQSIPELTGSAVLTQLRQKQTELNWRAAELQNKVGERHGYVIAIREELAGINKQVAAEAEHILGNMKNGYDLAVRREQSVQAALQKLTGALGNSESYVKLQQLRRVADTDRNLYQSYLSQYNDIAQRRTLQDASARIISPATLPTSPSSPRRKLLYGLGGMTGLGGGLLLAFLLEYFRRGIKTGAEIEQSFGLPVVGIIPLVPRRKSSGTLDDRLFRSIVDEPLSPFSEAVHAMRITLELSSTNSKVILVTSAVPAEGKSTAATLLAVSSARAGKRTVLLDCDLRQQSTSEAFGKKGALGLSELLRGTAELRDVITKDAVTNAYVIPAGSMVPNAADLLMSQQMRDLIAALRGEFDYIVWTHRLCCRSWMRSPLRLLQTRFCWSLNGARRRLPASPRLSSFCARRRTA